MGFLGNFKAMLKSKKVDVRARFEILRETISGTMSKFYMVRDKEREEIVGLKILDPVKTAAFDARLKGLKKPTEGEITAELVHPRIVKLHEHGLTTKDEQFLLMEFLDGPGLNSLLVAKSPLLEGNRVALIRQAAEALAAVHKAGYIHRDVCPRNLIATLQAASLKLIDFGLTIPAKPEFCQPGNRTGNPNYMAPELIRRMATDQRVDIFAFGVTAYEICTFELPWSRGLTGKAAMDHATKAPTDIREHRPTIEPRLAEAISKCLEQDVNKRLGNMEQFLKRIQGIEHEDVA